MRKKIKQFREKRLKKRDQTQSGSVPQITNDNVAEHREDMLSGARKYIYPLQHSKHRIVLITASIFMSVVVIFSIFSVALLYHFQTTSNFMYQVSRIVPFPIARSGGTFIAYENYLFELRHYIHYYENQQQLSFETEAGQAQLNSYKQRAIDKVVNDAYIKLLAKELNISVSPSEVDTQIKIAKEQNRLGSSDEIFEDVLREYWDWSVSDFRRSLTSELLAQKVIRASDQDTENRAREALARLKTGEEFGAIALEYSDDLSTKESAGEFGEVNKSNRNVSQQTVDTLFNLPVGQISEVTIIPYGTGYALEIVKNLGVNGEQATGAHVVFQLKSLDDILNDRKEQKPYKLYLDPVKPEQSTP